MKTKEEKLKYLFSRIAWGASAMDAKALRIVNTISSEIKQMEEDIDFLCTWCEFTTLDESDPHLQHHQEIIKRWKESNEDTTH